MEFCVLGFKAEWATVKDDLLYVGSMGKEWTTSQGVYVNHNPMWVKVISPDGEVSHIDWESKYLALRRAVNIDFPGIENKSAFQYIFWWKNKACTWEIFSIE